MLTYAGGVGGGRRAGRALQEIACTRGLVEGGTYEKK